MSEPETEIKPVFDYAKLDREMDRVKSKVFMGNDAAFYGPLMSSLDFYWSTDIETAATDGTALWWNPEFFRDAPEKYRSKTFNHFVMRHELRHVAGLHMLRAGNRDMRLWNYACDVRINNDEKRIGSDWGSFRAWYMPDLDLPQIMAEEEIYDHLFGSGFEVPESPWGNAEFELPTDKTKIARTLNNVVRSVTSARMEGREGEIPGNTESLLKHFLAPIIPWEQHLMEWHHELGAKRISWNKRNRRYQDVYLPSKEATEGRLSHLLYMQDVSGSITPAIFKRFNSELKYVWDVMKPKKMTIAQFDTIIQRVDVMEVGDDFNEVIISGGGGNDMECVRQFINEQKPTAAIIFADMVFTPMQPLNDPSIPVLWIAVNAPTIQGPFGKTIHIKG